jgi:hypothetical protein
MRGKKSIALALLVVLVLSTFACGGGGNEEAGATPTPTPTPTSPTIRYEPGSFSFAVDEGYPNPASEALTIWKTGGGTLDWRVSTDAPWLTLDPASGSSTTEKDAVMLIVDIVGMGVGNYTAAVTIEDPGATNSPQTVTVNLDITTPLWPYPNPGKGNLAGRLLRRGQGTKGSVELYTERPATLGFWEYATNTDEDGYFLFRNIEPGSYVFVACIPFGTAPVPQCWYWTHEATGEPYMVHVEEGATTELPDWDVYGQSAK